jgi:RNA polymerase sigma factor (sigma-70 family)
LLQAAQKFEAGNGAPLAGYAKFRIRGEMLDTVRRNGGRTQSTGLLRPAREDDAGWESVLPASPESSPHSSLLRKQRADIVKEEFNRLPARYRKVVGLRYSRDLTLRQIGAVLSVNESRACQLHRNALGRLKRALLSRGVRGFSHL